MMTATEEARHRKGIGARIRPARKTRGYIEARLAERIGVTEEVLAQVEAGGADLPLYQLMHIADVLMVGVQ